MKYSFLSIHCTSFCGDIIQEGILKKISHSDIDDLHDDIYNSIRERIFLSNLKRNHLFLTSLTLCILQILHIYKEFPMDLNASSILSIIQSRIEEIEKL